MKGILAPQAEVKTEQLRLTWPQVARRLAEADATAAALIDFDLRTGAIVIVGGLTAEQTRSFTKVPHGYQCTLAGLQPHERMRLRNGWASISEYHNRRTLTDAAIERFITKKAGIERASAIVDRILDQMTAPTMLVAAE
jgi:hypothetical protein